MEQSSKWYKNNPDDKIWWLNNPEVKGEWVFSFDKKTEFNMFRDYPHALTSEQRKSLMKKTILEELLQRIEHSNKKTPWKQGVFIMS